MDPLVDRGIGRRQFLKHTGYAACAVSGLALSADATAGVAQDAPNLHNMLVVGEQAVFLSHLPMFEGLKDKTAFGSPHRFQVIVEARFTRAGKDVSDLYVKDRQAHPDTPIYSLRPAELFVLSELFTPGDKPQLGEFTAQVFRDHHENPPKQPITGLEKTLVKATRVVHGREFKPTAKKPAELEYILFGKGSELFLAHAIFGPPDFDHVLSVKLEGLELKPDALTRDVRVTVRGRQNVVAQRLRAQQRTPASLRIGEGAKPQEVQLVAGREFYFEEGELTLDGTFNPTPEELKALKK